MSQPSTPSGRAHRAVLPVLTFVAGLLLGAGVMGAVDAATGSEDPAGPGVAVSPTTTAEPTTPAAPPPSSGPVPGPCLQAGESAQQVLELTDRALGAVASFDARRLEELVDQAQGLEPQLRQAVEACRDSGLA